MPEEWKESLRKAGGEYGAATGRPRRVGPFDAVASRYGLKCQRADKIALTKLDVLSYMQEIPIITGYLYKGKETDTFVPTENLEEYQPVISFIPGWKQDISACRRWEELPDALHPDELGTIFSGSAVIDYDNTAGFNKKNEPALVAAYTVDNPEKQRQCIAYSLDKGRTFTKYEGNPVIDSKAKWNSKDTRDPKVFWYAPGKHWVMVLNERDGHSIYNSADLKNWEYKSHVTGFWECPELFELPVDGDKNHTKWVMYGASGTYMLGSFDGQTFTPEAGKYYYYTGSMYAAQTYSNIPASDGRRIQIGWGRISHDGMPFNGMMLLPNELTLRTTSKGVRLFSVPVRETEQLFQPVGNWTSLSSDAANQRLQAFSGKDCLRIRTTIKLSHATSAGLNLYGQPLVDYDMNSNLINGVFYSPDDRTSIELTADIYIDRTSIEVFIDGGAYSYSMKRSPREGNREGLHFWGNNIEVKNLEVFSVKSIW